MLGDIVQLADNLWLVVGDMPADIPNSIIYLQNDRLYLMDTGAGPTIRASIMQVLRTVSPVHSFTLLNSHGHTDHIGNNDIIRMVHANNTSHYLSEAGLAMLDPVQYFADQFYKLSDIYDPAIGFQAHRLRWRFLGVLRDILGLFIGERRVLGMIFSVYLRKFQPFRPSLETIQTYESLSSQSLAIHGASFKGWVMGENDVWVLEARGHTPDEVLFYIPEHQVLHTGDLTLPLFPTFPNSDGKITREMLRKCKAMASSGAVSLLIDGHHHHVYRGKEQVSQFLMTLLTEHEHFQAILKEITEEIEGLTVGQVYSYIRQRHEDPVVQHYLSLEYPYLPMSLQQIIAVSLVQMGYETKGPRRRKRFYRTARAT
jgi:glyoxylase-like metal-dependent hydrolase (beta-lactamase superfamily II)